MSTPKKATETVKLSENVNGLNVTIFTMDGVESIRIEGPLATSPELSKSKRTKILAGTSGFAYLSDKTGVSVNVVEGVNHPRS